MGFVGTKITPMRDFWIDCYSTAIFSIMLSKGKVNKEYIYCNGYVYHYDVNEGKNLGRVYIKMKIDKIVDELLMDKEPHDFVHDEYFCEHMEQIFDSGKIVMLGIDMYYGISETFQWRRHHIRHYILVEGYDREKKEFYILETGESGYKEYTMSYEDLEKAAHGFNDDSYSYRINEDFQYHMYDHDAIVRNAEKVIDSIDEIFTHINDIWHVKPEYIISMRDEIDTHLKSMANRQKTNRYLFSSTDLSDETYQERFYEIEKGFFQLRSDVIETCTKGEYDIKEQSFKNRFHDLLDQEKNVWVSLCTHA